MGKKKKHIDVQLQPVYALLQHREHGTDPSVYEVITKQACESHTHFLLRAVAGIAFMQYGPRMVEFTETHGEDDDVDILLYANIEDAAAGLERLAVIAAVKAEAEKQQAVSEAERIVTKEGER